MLSAVTGMMQRDGTAICTIKTNAGGIKECFSDMSSCWPRRRPHGILQTHGFIWFTVIVVGRCPRQVFTTKTRFWVSSAPINPERSHLNTHMYHRKRPRPLSDHHRNRSQLQTSWTDFNSSVSQRQLCVLNTLLKTLFASSLSCIQTSRRSITTEHHIQGWNRPGDPSWYHLMMNVFVQLQAAACWWKNNTDLLVSLDVLTKNSFG